MSQWVYTFAGGESEGSAEMRNLLGGKGANLAEMANLGLPVPPGFTISTALCTAYYDNNETYPDDLKAQVNAAIAFVERHVGKGFGDAKNPLLVSVRSGARASMPGMMDTVLNLGLNDETVQGLAESSGDARFAYDSYRRFIQMYSDVVMGVEHDEFEHVLEDYKARNDFDLDTELQADDWIKIVDGFKAVVQEHLGRSFPQDVHEQLWGAVGAVFGSWMNQRAITYRKLQNIPASWGTAVNVQAMVFGNMGDTSATGVAFTRDPSTGANEFYGEFLINAQGEDVVAGIRTPQNITEAARIAAGSEMQSLENAMPKAYGELRDICARLEAHYKDMQDIEFTIEQDKLWMLQTRSGKRTTKAALKIAVDMVDEGLITQEQAVLRIDAAALDQLLHPTLDPKAERKVVARGLPASPGAASGSIVFNSDEAEARAQTGESVILVRVETSPEDIHGMHAAKGILTTRGGMTSHAAVVARGMGRPCVSGVGHIRIDYAAETMQIGSTIYKAGDKITIDGAKGEVIEGVVPTIQPELSGDFARIMEWADGARRMKVRANAETDLDAKTARKFGAEGIGLCRTEHMFFEEDRILAVREMILSETLAGRTSALAKLLPMQRDDFHKLFVTMAGLPVTIRLLDPPLHEFLPHGDKEVEGVAKSLGVSVDKVKARITELHEFNPMLGHRGCRLAITYPEVADMQARAIFEAAVLAAKETGTPVLPEIMVPLVMNAKELSFVKARIDQAAKDVMSEQGLTLEYQVGTMIELPRAALRAADIAANAEFFSFGTNDLTQTTLGISRDDAGRFLSEYEKVGIIERDPFVSIDVEGVGELVKMGVERGRSVNAGMKCGICGEHGGDPDSIQFCESVGLDYVSCSPYRVPIARLAAAQSAIKAKNA